MERVCMVSNAFVLDETSPRVNLYNLIVALFETTCTLLIDEQSGSSVKLSTLKALNIVLRKVNDTGPPIVNEVIGKSTL